MPNYSRFGSFWRIKRIRYRPAIIAELPGVLCSMLGQSDLAEILISGGSVHFYWSLCYGSKNNRESRQARPRGIFGYLHE
jgi:hypothetical protein